MKRRGFTLIELMVVIAIIIILAAIAIPNYLSMTARAKRSRVASDFAAIATALETYKTDWNKYPVIANDPITTVGGVAFKELTGTSSTISGDVHNGSNGTATAAGDMPPIEYMTVNILKSMVDPYTNTAAYYYTSSDGSSWTLTASTGASSGVKSLVRTSNTPTLADGSTPSG